MTARETLSVLAGMLYLVGFGPYIRGIFRGETKPAKASWIIWAILDVVMLAAMIAKESVNGQIIGAAMGACTVAILALRYGLPGWSIIDRLCLLGAALGIALWWLFREPTVGLVVSTTVILIGSSPTFVSAWKDPTREDRTPWMLYFLSCLLALAAFPAWTWEDASQPIAFTLIESVMMYLLYVRPFLNS